VLLKNNLSNRIIIATFVELLIANKIRRRKNWVEIVDFIPPPLFTNQ